jgi:hypothetical protein
MNPSTRKTTAIIGLTVAGAFVVGAFVANRMTRSKNNTVIWGINKQLDQMNSVADMEREEQYVILLK